MKEPIKFTDSQTKQRSTFWRVFFGPTDITQHRALLSKFHSNGSFPRPHRQLCLIVYKHDSHHLAQSNPSSETQGLLVGTMRYFRASDIFGAKVYFKGSMSPWALFLTKRVPEVSKSVPPEKYFSGQSTRRSSRVILSPFLHEVVFFIDRTGRFP